MTSTFPGLFPDEHAPPKSEKDWFKLDVALTNLFSPHAPIDEEELFSGRAEILLELIDVVFQRGLHAVLYGDRGVGKTSLSYILRDNLFSKADSMKIVRRQCTAEHDFAQIWRNVFDEFQIDGNSAENEISNEVGAYEIFKLFEAFPKQWRPIIIIDEFDRVTDPDTTIKMADTIKYLADTSLPVTIIIVGVGSSVAQLFGSHGSIHRNLRQIPMPRMLKDELRKIIDDRAKLSNMTIAEKCKDDIVEYSQGLPGYTHILGQAAFRNAARRRELHVEAKDLAAAMRKCVDDADETVRESYSEAIRSTQPSSLYREALLACALAETDGKGYFSAAAVREPLSDIIKRPINIFNYAQHIKQFCREDRGPALYRVGKRNNYQYRFFDALLRPYVIIKGISDGLI